MKKGDLIINTSLSVVYCFYFRRKGDEPTSRDRQVALWKGFKNVAASSEPFEGKVVVSGDILVVLDDAKGEARRITITSVRSSRAERGIHDR